ncbi:uncharacterized protein [Arachis hypogaea]|uniref:uncharacterized protein n=1 Tax=Arachis hypogaea TaxID=3818 RepID=UPI000DEDE983|nr:uncharacterized protein LOC112770152 [Arachis hypogaea]
MGAGYKGPNFGRVRGYLLSKLVEDVKKMIEQYREIWKRTGCTIMADGWTDRCRRTLINFLVYCPKGTIFLKSVDASHASKTAELLFKLFKDVVNFVGPENVVHIVTDNVANYVVAGRLLEAEFPKLYWSPCAAHCINLMLQDIEKLNEVSETVSHTSKITKYIYNHCHPLYLMRKFTGGREILRPAPTCFATNFIALQSILAQKDALRAMVTSKEWTISAYSKEAKAKTFVDQVLDSKFWNQCTDVVKLTEPLVRVLRIVDSEDKAAMGFLYQAFNMAREEMVKRFRRRKKIVEPYLKILDTQLNTKLTSEKRIYSNAEDDFGRQSALRERSTVMPDSPPFLTPEEVDALRNDLANMSIQPTLDDLDQLNLEDDQDNDGPSNNAMEDMDTNQNEGNVDQAPNLPYEDVDADFELTPWT